MLLPGNILHECLFFADLIDQQQLKTDWVTTRGKTYISPLFHFMLLFSSISQRTLGIRHGEHYSFSPITPHYTPTSPSHYESHDKICSCFLNLLHGVPGHWENAFFSFTHLDRRFLLQIWEDTRLYNGKNTKRRTSLLCFCVLTFAMDPSFLFL